MAAPEATNQKMFSIVMATYNCGPKIENTLRSIFSQNRELFELIVIDGASTDDTLDYIKKYEGDLTYISEKDDGVYHAFNKAIDLATGKYLYFIGAGDCLRPRVLEQIVEFMLPETPSLVYGNCYFVKQKINNGKEFTAALFARDNLCHQGMFFHRNVFDIIGKFDVRYRVFADWFLNLKCFIDDRITKRYIDRVIADYEEDGLSSVISRDPAFVKEFPLFIKKHFGASKYLVCKAFLRSPYLITYIYNAEFRLLLGYFISSYSLPKYLMSFVRPYVQSYRNSKNAVREKN